MISYFAETALLEFFSLNAKPGIVGVKTTMRKYINNSANMTLGSVYTASIVLITVCVVE